MPEWLARADGGYQRLSGAGPLRAYSGGELKLADTVANLGSTALRPTMNTDQIKGNWKQLVGKAKEKWGKLTDDDWKVVEGKRDQLIGKVQERYGITREEAERQLADFERTHEKV
jgi:uncharacterized protein YjbJ (UPF0337 family)